MSISLGKRKERDGEEQVAHGSTVFVSNLPYTATSTDLKTLFSDLAPVRSAFVVLEPGSGISKGVGYVSFAIREDAQQAVQKVSEEGIELNGRKLRVQWAESKNKDKQAKELVVKAEAKTPRSRPQPSATPHDPLAIRTVVISGLPTGIDSKILWKKIRKLEGAEKVEWPTVEEDHSIAHALFLTPAAASEAVEKLHAHVYKGSLLSATLKKRLDGLAKNSKKPQNTSDASTTKGPAPNHASRLIVRNLPFDITEQDLRSMFLPYGPIHSTTIPTVSNEAKQEDDSAGAKPRGKGFAFVWMLSRKDAERALEGCNGMTVQAGMAERLVSAKQKRKKQRRQEEKMMKAAAAVSGGDAEESHEEGDEGRHGKSRVIAVDWALSKDKWEQEKAKLEQEGQEEADVKMADAESSLDDDEDEDSGDSSVDGDEHEHIGVRDDNSGDSEDEGEDSESDGSSEDMDEAEEEPTKPTLPTTETETTLFVRNVPFEATEDEFRILFRAFGPLRYARITMDHETGRSRGTGFVCFWNKIDADKAIEQSEILRAETLGEKDTALQPKKNPFKLPSLLTPDPSSSMAQNLILHGRTLDVIRAVTRNEAGKLKEAGEKQREKADKRNLYLLREGIILLNTPAAESMSAAEVEKRTQSYNARRVLLRSNPSLYISRTRLSVRQIPLFVTERMLKRLAIHAMRTFEKDVKEGILQPLSEDELTEPAPQGDVDGEDVVKEEGNEPAKKNNNIKRQKSGRHTGVKQVKIIRQADRVDPITGKGRSKGYGFVEMTSHADALRVLRWANNNAAVGALFAEWWKAEVEDLVKAEKKKPKRDEARIKRLKEELERDARMKSKSTLIVEFSIENVQVVQRRAAQQRENQQKPGDAKKFDGRTKLKTEEVKSHLSDERTAKKRRLSEASSSSTSPEKQNPRGATKKQAEAGESKFGQKMGSMIGRKRKERKAKKRGV